MELVIARFVNLADDVESVTPNSTRVNFIDPLVDCDYLYYLWAIFLSYQN